MVYKLYSLLLVGIFLVPQLSFSDDKIELETITIKGNTELPKYMYVVPWQDRTDKKATEQKFVLNNLYADLFDPVTPEYIPVDAFVLHPVEVKEE